MEGVVSILPASISAYKLRFQAGYLPLEMWGGGRGGSLGKCRGREGGRGGRRSWERFHEDRCLERRWGREIRVFCLSAFVLLDFAGVKNRQLGPREA